MISKVGAESIRQWAAVNRRDSTTLAISRLLEANPPLSTSGPTFDRFAPSVVGLGLTAQCHLRCRYCHSEAGARGGAVIAVEAADAALDFVARCAEEMGREFGVGFIGPGEPTKPWDIFYHCVEKAEELAASRGLTLRLSMPTNGVFDTKRCEFVVEHFDRVCLSFDGPSWIQNLQRPLADGSKSFRIVHDTARFFHDNWGKGRRNFRFAIRATVSQEGLDRIEEIHAFFRGEFPRARIAYETLKPLGRGKSCASGHIAIPDSKHFADVISRLIGEDGSDLVSNSGACRLGGLKRSFCRAFAMPTMNVFPDGRVLACQCDVAPEQYEYGRFSPETHQFVFDYSRIKSFQQLSVDSFPECRTYIARYHCAGDCHELRRIGFRRCEENKSIVLTRLWKHVHTRCSTQEEEVCR